MACYLINPYISPFSLNVGAITPRNNTQPDGTATVVVNWTGFTAGETIIVNLRNVTFNELFVQDGVPTLPASGGILTLTDIWYGPVTYTLISIVIRGRTYPINRTFISAAVYAPPPDPHFASVSLLMHGNNAVDSSSSPITFTNTNVTFPSTTPLFPGISYIRMNGSNARLSSGSNTKTGLTLGNTDFTFEFFIRLPAAPSNWPTIFTNCVTTGLVTNTWLMNVWSNESKPLINFTNSLGFICTPDISNGPSIIPLNTWTHIAYSRTGSSISQYVNGTRVHMATITTSFDVTTPDGIVIGGEFGHTTAQNCLLAEIRITNGVGRYTEPTLPVPTAPFPNF